MTQMSSVGNLVIPEQQLRGFAGTLVKDQVESGWIMFNVPDQRIPYTTAHKIISVNKTAPITRTRGWSAHQ